MEFPKEINYCLQFARFFCSFFLDKMCLLDIKNIQYTLLNNSHKKSWNRRD